MRGRKLGTITTGQAPRVDVTPFIDAALGPDFPRRHVGLLDGMSRPEIDARFAPRVGAPSLVAKLLDGGTVALDKAEAEMAMQDEIDALERDGCTEIVLLCTGDKFWNLRCRRGGWLSEYDRVVASCLAALTADRRTVGVLVPLPERVAAVERQWWWGALPRRPIAETAWSRTGGAGRLADAARILRGRGAEIVLAHGMRFGERHRRIAFEASSLPVVLSNEVVAKMAAGIACP